MNKFFIALGSLIIVALFTALIGPYFVDWTSYRETFEREASAYIGRPVTVAGKASVRLLPTPVLSFTDIHIGDADRPDVEMERFRAEVELAPLLKGEVRVIQMAVERPRFHIDIGGLAENRGVFAGEWRLDPDRISLERLQIVDGSAVISDSGTGRSWRAEGIDAVVEATTLLGPARVNATLTLDGEQYKVRAGFGRLTDLNTIETNLWVESPGFPVTLSTDGTLHFAANTPPSYEGNATIEGAKAQADAAPSSLADFRISGAFSLEPADLTLEEMQLSYGAIERPLVIGASGQISFGETPRFDLSLTARQIDLDRTLGDGEGSPFAIEGAFASLVDLLPRAAPPPLPGSLRLDAQGVVVGGSVIQAVGMDLVTAGNSWVVEDFAAMLPGETRVDMSGTLGLSAAATFLGHARMTSKRPAALAAWWRGQAGSAGEIGNFAVESDLDLTPDNQKLTGLVATTPGGTIEGSVDVRRFPQSGERIITVNLGAEQADLVETRALTELLIGKTVSAGWADKTTLIFSADADVLTAGGIEARSVLLEGGLEEGQLNLRRLGVTDLAGATIDAHGSIDDPFGTPHGRIDASVKADDISGAAKFLASALPESDAVRRFEEVAPILSPVSAEISAEAGAAGERVSLVVNGSFADTHLSLQAEGSGSIADPKSFVGTLRFDALGQDSAQVLRQLGFDVLPVTTGPLRINAAFDGALASAGKLKLQGTAAGIEVAYDGETKLAGGRVGLAGELTAKSSDLDSVLMLAGLAAPGLEGHNGSVSGRLEYAADKLSLALSDGSFDGQPIAGSLAAEFVNGVKLSGTLEVADASLPVLAGFAAGTAPDIGSGEWSDAPFSKALPAELAVNLSLNAARLDLGAPIKATNATLDFALANDKLAIDLQGSEFAGGALKGSATADLGDGQSQLAIRINVEGASLQSLVWDRLGLPVASGTLDLSFEATGQGRSVAGLVATLAGSGSFTLSEGRFNALNVDALAAVMQAAEGDAEPDENAARETFASLFSSGALAFGRATGSLSIANGDVTIPPVSLEAKDAKVLADARLNLNNMTLDSDWTVRLEQGGPEEAQPYVPVSFSGPVVHPSRDVDLVPLLNLLRSRFQERKLKELEELQRKRDEAERRAAEEEARRAAEEEARLAAEEAARESALDAELTTGATTSAPVAGAQLGSVSPAPEPEPGTAGERAAGAGPATGSEAAPPAEPTPLDLAPAAPELQAEPEPAPEPTPRRTPVRRAQPAPPPPPASEPDPGPRFKTLPNGVVVKIR